MGRLAEKLTHLPALIPIQLLRAYQRFLSPALPRRCKYEPTCSAYAVAALRSHGLMRGSILAGWRLLRCNPFSHGGYDPVEAQTLFRSTHAPTRGHGEAVIGGGA